MFGGLIHICQLKFLGVELTKKAYHMCNIKIKAMLGMLGGGENICGWLAIHDGANTLGVTLHKEMTKLISVRGGSQQLEHRLLNHL